MARLLLSFVALATLSGCGSLLGLDDYTDASDAATGTGTDAGPSSGSANGNPSSSGSDGAGGDGASGPGQGGTGPGAGGGSGGNEAVCGDGEIGGAEVCDGDALGGESCESLGYPDGGDLACADDCLDFDRSDCNGIPPPVLRLPMNNAYMGTYLTPDTLRPRFEWEPVEVTGDPDVEYTVEYAPAAGDGTPDFTAPTVLAAGSSTEVQPPSPIPVSESVPVGNVFYWRVIACVDDLCSEPSSAWRIHLGRSRKDGNGDGIADVMVGVDRTAPTLDDTRYYFCTPSNFGLTHALPGLEATFLGDVNGDGFADVATTDGAIANIYFGAPQAAFPDTPSMTLQAPAADPGAGMAINVAGAGDLDGDGMDDIVIAAPNAPSELGDNGAGRAWIFRGGKPPSADPVRTIIGSSDDVMGANLRGLVGTDINGDGFADLLLGAAYDPDGGFGQGRVTVVFGGMDLTDTPTDVLVGQNDNDQFGYRVVVAGDVNADGFGDFLVRARGYDTAGGGGRVFLYVGAPGTELSVLNVATYDALDFGRGFGDGLAGVGDIDGDGFDDFAIGDTSVDSVPAPGDGRVTVYFGGTSIGTLSSEDVQSTATNSYLGNSVASAGDINGDGYADVVVLEPNYNPGSGVTGALRAYYGPTFPGTPRIEDGSTASQFDFFAE